MENARLEEILKKLKILEERVTRIENRLNLAPQPVAEETTRAEIPTEPEVGQRQMELEFRIGRFWLTQIGVIALTAGLIFLLTLPMPGASPLTRCLVGLLIVIIMFASSYFIRKNFVFISRTLVGGAQVLLYYVVLRLYYFSEPHLISSEFLALALLFAVLVFNFYLSNRLKSQPAITLNFLLAFFTLLISQNPFLIFAGLTILSLLAVYFYLKENWQGIFLFSLLGTYIFHLLWLVGNPLITKSFGLVRDVPLNTFFILIYFIIFTLGLIFRRTREEEDHLFISTVFLNCVVAYFVYLLATIVSFSNNLFFPHLLPFFLFFIFSFIFWARYKSRYATFFYSIFGYIALTVAIVAQFKIPNAFIWLSWQSLLVVITAIWFRSKFIVVANFFIFLIIFFAFLNLSGEITAISLSFGIVALLSARIMNWQKSRLELKTEMMRNAYLAVAFFIFPYALYHSLPREIVPLSWIGVAGLYFLLSIILNNMKYRWMAILTLFLTTFYLAILVTTRLNPFFRVASFLALGIVLLVVSILYTKAHNKRQSQTK